MRYSFFLHRRYDPSLSLLASRRAFLAHAAGKARAADSRECYGSSGLMVGWRGMYEGR